MNIIFFGSSVLGFDCCKAIVEAGYMVSKVFTLPASFEIKYKGEHERTVVHNSLHADFSYFEDKHGIPVTVVKDGIRSHVDEILGAKPDLIIVVGWYYMLPESLLRTAPKGCIGIHASLLPKYRGNAPLVWSMIQGETEAGVSLFYFSDGVDNGDLIGQRSFNIEETDFISDVLRKANVASRELILQYLPALESDCVERIKQDESLATTFPRRTPEDGRIDWNWDPVRIRNFIRAQSHPYPGAFTEINGRRITIWDASISE